MKKVMIVLITAIVLMTNVEATCYDKEINDWSESLEIKFEEVKNEEYPYSYLLMLNNPRTDIRVTAKDTYSNGTYDVEYDTDFKNYVVGSEIHFIDKEYTFTIYMNDNAESCGGEKLRTIKYTVAKYNEYNDTVYCEENPDADICGSYTKVNEDDADKIKDKIEEYYNNKIEEQVLAGKPWYVKVWAMVKEYSLYVIIPIVIVAIIYSVIIYIAKKRSEKE